MKNDSSPGQHPSRKTLLEIADCTCLRVRKTARCLTQIYDEALAPTGLTVTQFGILGNLSGRGKLAVGQLAKFLGMDPTSLNRTLQPLIRDGLVEEKPHPDDKRIRLIAITRNGSVAFYSAIPFWRTAQRHVREHLGEASVTGLNRDLEIAFNRMTSTPFERGHASRFEERGR